MVVQRSCLRLAVTGAVLALAALTSCTAAEVVGQPQRGEHRLFTSARSSSNLRTNNNITYHNGPVITGTVNVRGACAVSRRLGAMGRNPPLQVAGSRRSLALPR